MASLGLIGFWISVTLGITFSGVIYIFIPKLPQFFQDIFLYGKCRGKRKDWTFLQLLEIPKSWFVHFYLIGSIINIYMLCTVFNAYIMGHPVHPYITTILQILITTQETNIGAVSTILLIFLIVVQNARRLMECLFTSVYSKSTINLVHYAVGIIHYSTISFSILCEAPHLGSYRGKVTSLKHHIPQGGWFEYTSNPHYFFEIVIYLAFLIIATFDHHTFWVVIIFVVDNQIISGFVSHLWYVKEFKEYPKNRAAVVPFIL